MEIHILDVGCGSMALLKNPNGKKVVIDCNLTVKNKSSILSYVDKVFGRKTGIDIFICSHRDADHMRGINDLHAKHPIKTIWDPDVPGSTTDSNEYTSYMRLRRQVKSDTVKLGEILTQGDVIYRFMNGKWPEYSDPNQQSVVVKVEYKKPSCSVLFAGDTDYRPWKEKILPKYSDTSLSASILIAAHHGSITFFDDPSDEKNYYASHIKKIKPAMTLISVGPNTHGLPNSDAIIMYKNHSSGSEKGNKVYTTEEKKNMKITLKDDGGWSLSVNQ